MKVTLLEKIILLFIPTVGGDINMPLLVNIHLTRRKQ